MNNLKKKLGKNSGFTLVEMLIVVAIIAILIAVSIPLVSTALESARDRTDQANERSAKAEALMAFMGATKIYNNASATTAYAYEEGTAFGNGISTGTNANNPPDVYYDAASGKLVITPPTKGYGQCTNQTNAGCNKVEWLSTWNTNTHKNGHDGMILKVGVDVNGTVKLDWVPLP